MAKARVTKLSRIDWKAETSSPNLWDWTAMKSLMTDEAAAYILSCSAQSVRNARKRYGIEAWQSRCPREEMRISHPDLDWECVIPAAWNMETLVARVPDDALGLMMKCSTGEVHQRRFVAGVKPYPDTP